MWIQAAIQGSQGDTFPMPYGGQGNGGQFSATDPIVDTGNAMVAGAPNPLTGNSGHVDYTSLPGGGHVVVIDEFQQPSLYELFPGGTCGGTPTPTPTATATATPTGSPTGSCPPTITQSTRTTIEQGDSVSCNNGVRKRPRIITGAPLTCPTFSGWSGV